ncbi:hypothetical protein P2318_24200 [Myxococcaceae bacterium GXIMD 01537]
MKASPRAVVPALLLGAVLAQGCGGALNQPPRGTRGPKASVSEAAPGQVVHLDMAVVDDEGDPITIVWKQTPAEPAGTFNDIHAMTPTWVAPQVTTDTTFFLDVHVSDDHENAITGTATVRVRAPTSGTALPADAAPAR